VSQLEGVGHPFVGQLQDGQDLCLVERSAQFEHLLASRHQDVFAHRAAL
jgi:hypothetical protein